jgi:hypothetical protein
MGKKNNHLNPSVSTKWPSSTLDFKTIITSFWNIVSLECTGKSTLCDQFSWTESLEYSYLVVRRYCSTQFLRLLIYLIISQIYIKKYFLITVHITTSLIVKLAWIADRNHKFWYFVDRASQCIYLNINQLDALNFIMSLFQASTCFEHKCSSSGGQNCIIQSLVSSHL